MLWTRGFNTNQVWSVELALSPPDSAGGLAGSRSILIFGSALGGCSESGQAAPPACGPVVSPERKQDERTRIGATAADYAATSGRPGGGRGDGLDGSARPRTVQDLAEPARRWIPTASTQSGRRLSRTSFGLP